MGVKIFAIITLSHFSDNKNIAIITELTVYSTISVLLNHTCIEIIQDTIIIQKDFT